MRKLTINRYEDSFDYAVGSLMIHRKSEPDESVTGVIDDQDYQDFILDKTQTLERVEIDGTIHFKLVR